MLFNVLLFCALLDLAAAQTVDDCPLRVPRDEYLQVHGDFCYRFVFSPELEYKRAAEYCENVDGTLVMVKSQIVQDYLNDNILNTYGHLGSSGFWIGLTDLLAEEGKYVWADGSNMEFSNWGVPPWNYTSMNNYEDCVAMNPLFGGKWLRFRCSLKMDRPARYPIESRLPFVCQAKLSEDPTKIRWLIP